MSITRTAPYGALTDDSGAGTDGTTFNNAWLQGNLNLLDARWSRVTITSTGSQNNLSITEADFVVFNNASDLTITGIVAPSPAKPGKPFRFVCIGAGNVFFAHQSASSTAANRLVNFATSGNTPCAGGTGTAAGGRGMYVYDDVNSRWQLVAHEQGAWITQTYASGDYTASAGTWTVDSGDVLTNASRLSGRTLTWDFDLNTTTTSAGMGTDLKVKIPGGFTAAAKQFAVAIRTGDNNVADVGKGIVTSGGATLIILRTRTEVAWTSSVTNGTYVGGQITIEVA